MHLCNSNYYLNKELSSHTAVIYFEEVESTNHIYGPVLQTSKKKTSELNYTFPTNYGCKQAAHFQSNTVGDQFLLISHWNGILEFTKKVYLFHIRLLSSSNGSR